MSAMLLRSIRNAPLQRQSRIAIVGVLATGCLFTAIALAILWMSQDNRDSWRHYRDQSAEKERAIGALVESLGYGGMIHHFKNYVLRREEGRHQRVTIGVGGALAALEQYGREGLRPDEERAIADLRAVITAYAQKLDEAHRMAEAGSDARAIDRAVVVDDGPALAGIELLKARVQADRKITDHLHHKQLLNRVRADLGYGGLIHHFKNYILRRDSGRIAKVRDAAADARRSMTAYRELGAGPQELAEFARVEAVIQAYVDALDRIQVLAAGGSTPEEIDRAVRIDDGPALDALNALDGLIADRTGELKEQIESNFADIRLMALAIVAIAIAGSILLSLLVRWILQDAIAAPVERLTGAMHALASGDIDIDLETYRSGNEIGAMVAATRVFRDNLRHIDALQKDAEERARRDRLRHQDLEAYISELQTVVGQCVAGDFSKRIAWQSEQAFVTALNEAINELVETTERGLADVADVLSGLADGDLDRRIVANYRGAFGALKASTNRTAERLSEIVTRIRAAAEQVDSAAAAIGGGTEDLSRRTGQAASSLEETTASAEEMAATVRQNAESARHASRLADDADRSARIGGSVVEQAVGAMSRIEQSARKITDIIGVIDEIAFQTNLLALNASVEAARAGDAGKGFAVVAQEVRQLAQRSAQAAADIKLLIQDSNGQVKDGVELVNQAGESLTEIVGSIGNVATIVQEISTASEDQAREIQAITASISHLDQITQQNASLVEQSTAAARTLNDESRRLIEMMAFFKLKDAATPRPRPAPKVLHHPQAAAAGAARPGAARIDDDDGWHEF